MLIEIGKVDELRGLVLTVARFSSLQFSHSLYTLSVLKPRILESKPHSNWNEKTCVSGDNQWPNILFPRKADQDFWCESKCYLNISWRSNIFWRNDTLWWSYQASQQGFYLYSFENWSETIWNLLSSKDTKLFGWLLVQE